MHTVVIGKPMKCHKRVISLITGAELLKKKTLDLTKGKPNYCKSKRLCPKAKTYKFENLMLQVG